MKTAIKMKVEGLDVVMRRLKKLGNPADRARAVKKAGKEAMKPALAMAKQLVPKRSGLGAESLGIVSQKNGSENRFIIQPRRSFRGAGNTAVGDSDKSKAAHAKAGRNVFDGIPPHFYLIIVATGRIPLGNASDRFKDPQLGAKVRTPNNFLQKTYDATHQQVPIHFSKNLDGFIRNALR